MSSVSRNHFGFAACRGARRSRGQAPAGAGNSALPRPACCAPDGANACATRRATQKVPAVPLPRQQHQQQNSYPLAPQILTS
eukprot:4434006-Heterocapsa_arctica.AAC.1